jgi:hypothetical protein
MTKASSSSSTKAYSGKTMSSTKACDKKGTKHTSSKGGR